MCLLIGKTGVGRQPRLCAPLVNLTEPSEPIPSVDYSLKDSDEASGEDGPDSQRRSRIRGSCGSSLIPARDERCNAIGHVGSHIVIVGQLLQISRAEVLSQRAVQSNDDQFVGCCPYQSPLTPTSRLKSRLLDGCSGQPTSD